MFLAAIVGISCFAIAVSTGDLLWFWPAFDGEPESILVHCEGRPRLVRPDSAAFEELSAGLNESFWGIKQWTELSMSEATWNDYVLSEKSKVLEYHYSPPESIHSYYRFFKSFDTLIVPLEGRHAQRSPVFGLKGDLIIPGSLQLESNEPLKEIIREYRLCP